MNLIEMWNQMGFFAKAIAYILFIMSMISFGVVVERFYTFLQARKQSKLYAPQVVKYQISTRLKEGIQTIQKSIMNLQNIGYLKRVTGALVEYRIDRKNKVTKYRHHTYYDLTRKGTLFIRHFHGKVEVNLRPPYKQV